MNQDKKSSPIKKQYGEVANALAGLSSNTPPASTSPIAPIADVPLVGVDLPFAMPNYCGDFHIRILQDGTWLYQNSPIGRKPLCKLFASVMHRDHAGDYWLVTPAERGRITVDVAPFTFVEYQQDGNMLNFRSNLDEWVTLDADHPLEMRAIDSAENNNLAMMPFITIRGRLQGLLVRSLFYQLVEIAQIRQLPDGQSQLYITSAGVEFSLGCVDADE